MTSMLAITLFGRDLPNPGVLVILVVLAVGFFLMNRSAAKEPTQEASTGGTVTCGRCNNDFQPEKVELTDNGDVHRYKDDRCPDCGWHVG